MPSRSKLGLRVGESRHCSVTISVLPCRAGNISSQSVALCTSDLALANVRAFMRARVHDYVGQEEGYHPSPSE